MKGNSHMPKFVFISLQHLSSCMTFIKEQNDKNKLKYMEHITQKNTPKHQKLRVMQYFNFRRIELRTAL